ncbi:MAG: phage tail protein [Verrucomicrobia bacterium]|nr:phage tail protein [Verrucomicrobiota bacterium]MBI3868732.1 phage tail protein [Verrucomicrobiota bacterium]
MADPFLAEIRLFGFNFAPRGWAFCTGQILPIGQNTALFSLLGTTYGGNGRSTFALPNLEGAVVMHPGHGPGLSNYDLGQSGGQSTVTLLNSEMPQHSHALAASNEIGEDRKPSGEAFARSTGGPLYGPPPVPPAASVAMAPAAIGVIGGNQPHNNMMPHLAVSFCIALQGIYPARG